MPVDLAAEAGAGVAAGEVAGTDGVVPAGAAAGLDGAADATADVG